MSIRRSDLEAIGPATALVVIDMQRLFSEATEWRVPTLPSIIPAIRRLIEARPDAALFTRFLTPPTGEHALGRWQKYYRRWSSVTLAQMTPDMLDLVPEIAAHTAAGTICDKKTLSSLADGPLAEILKARKIDTLVLAGVETDVCVLATLFDAVDLGFRVVVAADAVTSASLEGHAATIDILLPRHDEQVDVATVDHILAAWQTA